AADRPALPARGAPGALMNLDWNIVWQHRWDLAHGAGLTVLLTVLTMLAAVPAGIVLALMRLSRSRILSTASLWFVEFFRNLPLILVVYWAFYVMPVFLHIEFSAFTTGLIALCLNVSAYNAETFRAGINSIRKGQMEAAIAVGMSRWQAMKQIIIPQAWRRVLPVLASTWVSLFKDTSLVSVIAVGELAHVALQIRSSSFRVLEMLTAMAVIYWLMGYPQAKLVDWIHKRFEVKE
ncbi:MAG: amino acid ABC transporter permease, partial [Polaromonas sp.]|nr:amino acid ABC transporter permease [Polaromonas sp.]